MRVFGSLLFQLSRKENNNFYINIHNKLVVRSKTIGKWNKIKTDTNIIYSIKEIDNISNYEKLRLFTLMDYLYKNKISGAYLNKYFSICIFGYKKHHFYSSEHDYRNIILRKEYKDIKKHLSDMIVLDKKEGLMLVAPDLSYLKKPRK